MFQSQRNILSVFTLLCASCIVLAACGSDGPQTQPNSKPNNTTNTTKANLVPKPFPGQGSELLAFVQEQVDQGPRVPGSDAHRKTRDILLQHLVNTTDTAFVQPFTASVYGTDYECWNIIGQVNPAASTRVLLCAHWDTRPMADFDPDPTKREHTFDGANDGGSGVGALLGIAKHIANLDLDIGIDFVLFDAEDMGKAGDADMFCIGSRYFSQNLPMEKHKAGILLDLVGDPNAIFPLEGYSQQYAPGLLQLVWQIGTKVAPSHFVYEFKGAVQDDHVPLNEVGIPTIDIIDIQLVGHNDPEPHRQYWHTSHDTMDKVSANTLQSVADVVWRSVQQLNHTLIKQ